MRDRDDGETKRPISGTVICDLRWRMYCISDTKRKDYLTVLTGERMRLMGANYGCGDYECIATQDKAVSSLNEILALMESGENTNNEWISNQLLRVISLLKKNAHMPYG